MNSPHYGLVCLTVSKELRFKTITLSRFLNLQPHEKISKLRTIYRENIRILQLAAAFCEVRNIRLYRMSSSLFPMLDLVDETVGAEVFAEFSPQLAEVGKAFAAAQIRVLMHPEQFIVLNSEHTHVRANSLRAISNHANVMDALGLEQNHYNLLLLHGGKRGRGAELQALIPDLPPSVRLRLALENDERAYSPAELITICEKTNTPLVFDAHHHVVHDKLPDFEHESIRHWVLEARRTWQPPEWQLVHLSNGLEGFHDRRHSYLITHIPSAYADVPWIEVEAKGKEEAIAALLARSGD